MIEGCPCKFLYTLGSRRAEPPSQHDETHDYLRPCISRAIYAWQVFASLSDSLLRGVRVIKWLKTLLVTSFSLHSLYCIQQIQMHNRRLWNLVSFIPWNVYVIQQLVLLFLVISLGFKSVHLQDTWIMWHDHPWNTRVREWSDSMSERLKYEYPACITHVWGCVTRVSFVLLCMYFGNLVTATQFSCSRITRGRLSLSLSLSYSIHHMSIYHYKLEVLVWDCIVGKNIWHHEGYSCSSAWCPDDDVMFSVSVSYFTLQTKP